MSERDRAVSFRVPLTIAAPALLIALAICGLSQQPPVPRGRRPNDPNSTPTGPPPKPGTVEGSVTNALSHAPIRQAIVSINSTQGYTYVGQTDDGGKFHIPNVSPGSYFVGEARAQSFRYRPPGRVSSGQITVAEAQDVTGVKVEMEPLGVITGKVVDDDGEPVRDAQVMALASDYSRGTRMLNAQGYSQTDDRGEFRLFDLIPGRYLVRASLHPDFSPVATMANVHRNTPEMGYAATYYPQGTDSTQAVASEVAPGAEVTGVDIRLHSVPVYHIRGKLNQGSDSGPSGGVTAAPCGSATPSVNVDQLRSMVNQSGAFDIPGVTPGTWCVTLQRGGPNARAYGTATASITDHSVEGVIVDVAAMTAVPGVVIVDGQSTQQPNFNITLQRSGAFAQNGNAQVKDLAFSIANVVPETYQVMVRGLPQGWYLKSMQYGSQDISEGTVTLHNDGTTLTLVVGTDGGQLSGTVQTDSGDPAINARVIVAPTDRFANRRDLLKFTGVDPTGHFQSNGLAPGEYKVYACEDPDFSLWYAVELRNELSSHATTITINAGSSSTAQLKTISADDLAKAKAKLQ